MKILFIGTFIPEEKRELMSRISSSMDFPGFVLQNSIHKGLSHDNEIQSIVVPALKTKITNSKIPQYTFNWNGQQSNYSIQFYNVRGLKELIAPQKVISCAISKKFRYDVIFVYSVGTIPFLAATYLKRKYPGTKIVSMVTDLPEFMSSNNNFIYRSLKFIDSKIINRLSKYFDGFILLSPYMRERFPVNDKKWIQIEGIYNSYDEALLPSKVKKENFIFYSGALDERYGILDLIYAFEKANLPKYELHLCGKGNAVEQIKAAEKRCSRIKYLGVLDHKEVLFRQRKATLLVNPRKSSEIFTKYSFPSKTMEYLASGTPVLMSHLSCIPKDYDEHMFYFEDESVVGMKRAMEEILSIPTSSLEEKGTNARKFIINNKNCDVQATKIINFIDSL